mmetsp:Transcript_44677/g.112613  ORF Transcript_44677/g.112613 Transcript_44677/m.112613 type:complete len:223 (-) Transcript_44677:139-807(-)
MPNNVIARRDRVRVVKRSIRITRSSWSTPNAPSSSEHRCQVTCSWVNTLQCVALPTSRRDTQPTLVNGMIQLLKTFQLLSKLFACRSVVPMRRPISMATKSIRGVDGDVPVEIDPVAQSAADELARPATIRVSGSMKVLRRNSVRHMPATTNNSSVLRRMVRWRSEIVFNSRSAFSKSDQSTFSSRIEKYRVVEISNTKEMLRTTKQRVQPRSAIQPVSVSW